MFSLSSADFFLKININLYDTNCSGLDQDQRSVDPELDSNCLHRLLADGKSPLARKLLKLRFFV